MTAVATKSTPRGPLSLAEQWFVIFLKFLGRKCWLALGIFANTPAVRSLRGAYPLKKGLVIVLIKDIHGNEDGIRLFLTGAPENLGSGNLDHLKLTLAKRAHERVEENRDSNVFAAVYHTVTKEAKSAKITLRIRKRNFYQYGEGNLRALRFVISAELSPADLENIQPLLTEDDKYLHFMTEEEKRNDSNNKRPRVIVMDYTDAKKRYWLG